MSHDIHAGDNPADDFDLFWGMGPANDNEKQQQQHRHHAAAGTSVVDISTTSSSSSAPSHSAGSTLPSAAGPSSSSLGGGSGGGLNPTATTLMGSLWSHSGGGAPEAYGHRHHVHASHGDGGAVAGLHHVHRVPSPVRSRRPVWLPPPNQHHPQHSSTSSSTAASRAGGVGAPGSNHVGQHHHLPSTGSPVQAVVVDGGGGDAASISPPSSSARINGHNLNSNSSSTSGDGKRGSSSISSNVECKLEELAAAIKSSVLGKLDTGVREALLTGQQLQRQRHQQSGGGVPFSTPRTGAAFEDDQRRTEAAEAEAVAAAVAPLRSRLAALEEQMSQLMASASLDRNGSSNSGGGDTRKGGRGSSGGVGGGVGLGRAGGGGSAAEAEPLLALNALAQRTGTLEGRHKQVQAKVALLDNTFGPKASDWAQTIKAFLQEREAAAGVAAAPRSAGRTAPPAPAPAVHYAPGGGGGKGGKRKLAVDAPVFSPSAARAGCGSGGAPTEVGVAAALTGPSSSVPLVVVAGSKHDESARETVGEARRDDTAEANSAAPATTSEATERAGGRDKVIDRCTACSEAQERCSRLEKRVAESEEALAVLQSKAPTITAAATTAVADAVKAWEAAENERRDTAAAAVAATAEKAAASSSSSSSSLGRQQKVPPALSGGGGAGNWASKSSLEKLAGELRHLSERTRDGEDAVALVDHGLKGVRDEMAPLSGSVSALKRLVETQLREKEQAAELLKGYVTTITREVATTTRHYINGLVAPGALAATGSGGEPEQNAQRVMSSSAGGGARAPVAPVPLAVLHSSPPVVVSVDDVDGVTVENSGVDGC